MISVKIIYASLLRQLTIAGITICIGSTISFTFPISRVEAQANGQFSGVIAYKYRASDKIYRTLGFYSGKKLKNLNRVASFRRTKGLKRLIGPVIAKLCSRIRSLDTQGKDNFILEPQPNNDGVFMSGAGKKGCLAYDLQALGFHDPSFGKSRWLCVGPDLLENTIMQIGIYSGDVCELKDVSENFGDLVGQLCQTINQLRQQVVTETTQPPPSQTSGGDRTGGSIGSRTGLRPWDVPAPDASDIMINYMGGSLLFGEQSNFNPFDTWV